MALSTHRWGAWGVWGAWGAWGVWGVWGVCSVCSVWGGRTSGGTTEVMIMEQCRNNLKRETEGSWRPSKSTWPAARRAKARRAQMKTS
eukprot:7193336-Prymnesium_polylepis.1